MPDPVRIEFGPVNRRLVGTQRVYTKQRWSDDWTLQPFMEVDEITWSCAPSIPVATLTWHYGSLARPTGPHVFGQTLRKSGLNRFYVRIDAELEFDDDNAVWTEKRWYGILDVIVDNVGGTIYQRPPGGPVTIIPTGEQQLYCYGLERLLWEHFVFTSRWRKDDAAVLIERGITFNYRGRPNRHENPLGIGGYVFTGLANEAGHWSTRKAVQYLLRWQTPTNAAGSRKPPFEIAPGFELNLPDWDQPELPTHGIRTYDLIDQLIPRQRMTGWYCDVREAGVVGDDVVQLKTFTGVAANVVLGIGPARPILANPAQYHLVHDEDRTARVELKDTTLVTYDQVIVQGGRRRSCGTVCKSDDTLDRHSTDDEVDDYNAAASTAADYPPAAEVKKRQERNKEARASDKLRHVFRRYEIPIGFAGMVGGGLEPSDPMYEPGGHPLFPVHDAGVEDPVAVAGAKPPFPAFKLEWVLEPTLPLLAGVDYTSDKIKNRTVDESTARRNREELPMLVCWKLPNTDVGGDDQRWANVEQLGRKADLEKVADSENHKWSASVHVVDHEPAFELHVHGAPQHVIAGDDFEPLDVDEKTGPLGEHDWREMLATICIPDDRFVEGRWPAAVPAVIDSPRILRLDAGDSYKQDYVAKGTVVSINATTGQLERSSGGYVRDDSTLLRAAAKVAYEYYGTTRRSLTLTTEYLLAWELGSFITQLGDDVDLANPPLAVNSPITEIKLSVPRGTPEECDVPRMSITTGAGELDPLRMLPRGGQALRGDAPNVLVPKL